MSLAYASCDNGLDVEAVRADFPILSREVHGKPLCFLDSAASAQKPRAVIDAVRQVYEAEYANVHRGLHYLSNLATDRYEWARRKVAGFINAPSENEVVFTRNATEAINLVAYSYAMPRLGEGDEIVLTTMEHHANIVPWHFLRERQGCVLKWVDVEEDGSFSLEAFEAALTERTKFVAITHMSNVLGTVVPVKDVCRIARERGIATLIDGCQGAVHEVVDVQDIGCDFYAVAAHKLYGPSGVGVLWGREELLNDMRPFNGGGEMIEEVTLDGITYNHAPHRFEAGTPPIAQAIGFGHAIEYVEGLGREAIRAHEHAVGRHAAELLREVDGVRVIGEAPGKGAIFAFEVQGAHAHDIATVLDRYGIAVRAGTHCAQPLLKRFGATSTCRASFGVYNTVEEAERLADGLRKAQEFFG